MELRKRTCCGVAALIGSLVVAYGPASVSAQVVCGDTIDPGEEIVLAGDIGPCDSATGDPAVTIEGPAMFDMNGYELVCDDPDDADRPRGIVLEGKKVELLNGTVRGCAQGVLVAGEGKHEIRGVVARGNLGNVATNDADGFHVESDGNKIVRNVSNDNEAGPFVGDGFHVVSGSDKNKLIENAAADNSDAFQIDGDKNTLARNIATNSEDWGFEIAGDGNKLVENHTARNYGGFEVDGVGNKLKQCVAIRNDDYGFRVTDDGNRIERCVALDHAIAAFVVSADGNQLKRNRALNGGVGIRLTGEAQGNAVKQNFVQLGQDLDLEDQNADCDDNTWRKNVFVTSKAGGVQDHACIE